MLNVIMKSFGLFKYHKELNRVKPIHISNIFLAQNSSYHKGIKKDSSLTKNEDEPNQIKKQFQEPRQTKYLT